MTATDEARDRIERALRQYDDYWQNDPAVTELLAAAAVLAVPERATAGEGE